MSARQSSIKASARKGRPVAAQSAEARSARLVQAAIEVIARDGLSQTSTRAIAAAAGMNQAMLHYAFASKEALLLAVIEHLRAEVQTIAEQATREARTVDEAIEKLALGYWSSVVEAPQMQRVQCELTLFFLRSPDTAALAARQYRGYLAVVAQAFARAQGEQKASAALRQLAGIALATMDGLILQWLALGRPRTLRRQLDLAVTALQTTYRGLYAQP